MMKKPDYHWGDKVHFRFNGNDQPLEGIIEIVDANGTFGQNEEPSYDIAVPEHDHCLYKHIRESDIIQKLPQEPVTRGILQYDPRDDVYSVLYSRDGYAALIDNPLYMEIRIVGTREWLGAYMVDLKSWLGKAVEIRSMPPYLMVWHLGYAHQDDTDMTYEVYYEDANVTLYEGGFVMWKPENLLLRAGKHHVMAEYSKERVFRWDVWDGVMRLCLGKVHAPNKRTLILAEEHLKMLADRNERNE